jgi:RimJ/RimL family protein N-acetyltransferase
MARVSREDRSSGPQQDRLTHVCARPHASVERIVSTISIAGVGRPADDWRAALPTLPGSLVALRELRAADAPALFAAVTAEEVSRFISPPPTTVEGFDRFIAWTVRQREAGQCVCFAIVPKDAGIAIGLVQIRALEPGFGVAEWGVALAREYWGSGAFVDGAKQALDFAFHVLGIHRLEARAATVNARGNGALRKIGARQEGLLRKSFLRNGEYFDQALWTLLADEWLETHARWEAPVIH